MIRILYVEDDDWCRKHLGIIFEFRLPGVTLEAPPSLAKLLELVGERRQFDLLAISPELSEWHTIYRNLSSEIRQLMVDPCFILCLTSDDALRAAMRDEYGNVFSKYGQRTILSAKKNTDGVCRALDDIQDLFMAPSARPNGLCLPAK